MPILKSTAAKDIVAGLMMPGFLAERNRLDRIDKWYRWDHEDPHKPKQATAEYKELQKRSQTPWLGLVVTSVAQSLYVDGYRPRGSQENATAWDWWQINQLDSRQVPIHRAALAYGYSFATVLPGTLGFGTKAPVIRGHSPRRMFTVYDEPQHDDWPRFALVGDPVKRNGSMGWALKLYDDTNCYYLQSDSGGSDVTYIEYREHNLGICPVVRFANQLDLEGRTPGEVEPFIPLAARIDQTVFDRLVVQRFASWVVRTVAGMAKPDGDEDAAAARLRLMVEDLLVAEDHETKFGHLPATPLDGFLKAVEDDIRQLAAVSQTPAYEMLGQMANLSAEALEAARASLSAKVEERQQSFGESHEQVFRLAAHVMGDDSAKRDYSAEVKWRDTKIRSLAQAADALGKLATLLQVPVQNLWEKIPGWTDQDVAAAKAARADESIPPESDPE